MESVLESSEHLERELVLLKLKVRPDREFWRGLLRIKEPVVLAH